MVTKYILVIILRMYQSDDTIVMQEFVNKTSCQYAAEQVNNYINSKAKYKTNSNSSKDSAFCIADE